MIEFGKFEFNNCIIKKYEASKFTHSKFNNGKTSYNLYIVKPEDTEEDFFVIANELKDFDIRRASDLKRRISISGTIMKNPNTHKILYVVNDSGFIKLDE